MFFQSMICSPQNVSVFISIKYIRKLNVSNVSDYKTESMKIDLAKIGLDPVLHFEAVARCRSLKLAARELGLSQPAVSHSLNKLEQRIGTPLCLRSRAQFALTEAGKELFRTSQDIKARLKGFEQYLSSKETFDGVLSIGILDHLQSERVERALNQVIAAFPKMKLSLQVYTAAEIQRLVWSGELDVGVGIFNAKQQALRYTAVGEETIYHYISDRHPMWDRRRIAREDVAGLNIAWSDIVSRDRSILESEIFIPNKVPKLRVGSYSNNLHGALQLLSSGHYIVPLPREYIESRKLNFKYRSLKSAFKPYALRIEAVNRSELSCASPASKFFLDYLSGDLGK
jgi:DNA-binding transcriptional LysR family regulator